MRSSTIILFGLFSAILMISLCISLNASKYYSELESEEVSRAIISRNITLRDRNYQKNLELSQKVKR